MDEAMVRSKCEKIAQVEYYNHERLLKDFFPVLYRAAYADGLEAAASYIASLDQYSKPRAIAAIIRNQAKEMGHE